MSKKRLIQYLSTTGICAAITVYYIVSRGLGGKSVAEVFRILADGFTIPALLVGSLGLMMIIADTGTLDGVVYGMQTAFKMLTFQFVSKKKPMNYGEFKEQREENRRERRENGGGFGYLVVVSGVFLLFAVVFVLLFYKYSA